MNETKIEIPPMKVHRKQIYQRFPAQYDVLGNILKELVSKGLLSLERKKIIVDMGAGTGKLSMLFNEYAKHLILVDPSVQMLEVAGRNMKAVKPPWELIQSDALSFRAKEGSVDLFVCGWCLHEIKAAAFDKAEVWQRSLTQVFEQMIDAFPKDANGVPHGDIIILETLGASVLPKRSGSHYYKYLLEIGFQESWVRSDYLFETREQAQKLIHFFFNDKMVSSLVATESGFVLPECCGIFHKKI